MHNTAPSTIPLPLFGHAADQTIALRNGDTISARTFLRHVTELANALPAGQFGINLCEDRYHFLVAFAAVLLKGQTNLLPPSHTAKTIHTIAERYPDSYCLLDHEFAGLDLPKHTFGIPPITDREKKETAAQHGHMQTPCIPYNHVACIPFTSGSTGAPNPNPKTWGRLLTVTKLIQKAFAIRDGQPLSLIATVPPQHMYGLETSILLPLVSGTCMHSGRPFYPEDIRRTLEAVEGPKVLITTPIHLRACVHARLHWPSVEFIISATAPLPAELAMEAEQAFHCEVLEIYGCTEFGSMATRRTVQGDRWRLFDGLQLAENAGEFVVDAQFLPNPLALSDIIEILPEHHFRLLGRKTDLVNIAGKRASMADLNIKLLAIPGVKDGVIFYPEEKSEYITRLIAFVVAPELSQQQILSELKQHFDTAFLPRPIYKVAELPREKSGKLPRKTLLALLEQVSAPGPEPQPLMAATGKNSSSQ